MEAGRDHRGGRYRGGWRDALADGIGHHDGLDQLGVIAEEGSVSRSRAAWSPNSARRWRADNLAARWSPDGGRLTGADRAIPASVAEQYLR